MYVLAEYVLCCLVPFMNALLTSVFLLCLWLKAQTSAVSELLLSSLDHRQLPFLWKHQWPDLYVYTILLTTSGATTMLSPITICHLDHCHSLLAGLPESALYRLLSIPQPKRPHWIGARSCHSSAETCSTISYFIQSESESPHGHQQGPPDPTPGVTLPSPPTTLSLTLRPPFSLASMLFLEYDGHTSVSGCVTETDSS